MSVRPSVCMYVSFGRTATQLFLEVVGEVWGSVSYISNNYFDVFNVTHVKRKEIFCRENVAQIAFRSIISTGIACNKYCILFR